MHMIILILQSNSQLISESLHSWIYLNIYVNISP